MSAVRKQQWSLKTKQNVNFETVRIEQKTNEIKINFLWEFDPGSGWTLAACLRHASRTRRPNEDGVLAQSPIWITV